MTKACPKYVAPFQAQLGQKNGGTLCTAVAATRVAAEASCGALNITGAHLRSLTNEPDPDPKSPGLNIPQVVSVLEDDYRIPMDVFVGSRALTWAQYEARRARGEPGILQIGYGPIADSSFDAGHGFRGGHGIAETTDATYESLADGRKRGGWKAWRFDGRLYPRDVIRHAAEVLVTSTDAKGHPRFAGKDNVWCAFAPDVVSETRIGIHPPKGQRRQKFGSYVIRKGVIVGTAQHLTGGFSARARMRCIPWPGRQRGGVYALEILDGAHDGLIVSTKWEMAA